MYSKMLRKMNPIVAEILTALNTRSWRSICIYPRIEIGLRIAQPSSERLVDRQPSNVDLRSSITNGEAPLSFAMCGIEGAWPRRRAREAIQRCGMGT
jgi:hypothetical protein